MKRSTLITAACSMLLSSVSTGQTLSKHPTIQQVVSYQQYEQRQWNTLQLPKNSVLFQSDRRYAAWQSFYYTIGKEKKIQTGLVLSKYELPAARSNSLSLVQSNFSMPTHRYRQWQRDGWLKDFLGTQNSLWLRDLIIEAKNHTLFR